MPVITLPDGSEKSFDAPVTVREVAESISPGLARAAVAGQVNDQLVDTFYQIQQDANIRIITDKDPEGLEVIRHSCAHLLAQAVKSLFPTAQVTIGPVIENGFYYDFAFSRAFSTEDLASIEEKMAELVKMDIEVSRQEVTRDEAIKIFQGMGEEYKVKIIQDIPSDEVLSIYHQGDFADLCRGPHIPRTGMLKAFKLTKVSGAYWRGDSKNEMLQRIYGTAWQDKKALKLYLKNLEEAEKRDHRKIGKNLDLFHFQEEAPGMVFWHENGWTIYQTIKNYVRDKVVENNYLEVASPQVVDLELWRQSGHWDMFGDEMFTVDADDRHYAIKPMNCPCHVQIFKHGLRSYRDLPIRFSEFGLLHRNELSGAMHGLMRVRQMVQDDAHIFCTEQQIQDEALSFIKLLIDVYQDFGFEDLIVRLATRPEKRIGSDELWDNAEQSLSKALQQANLEFELLPEEGAFYGPKIEFHLKDCLGRMWQCGTLQLDYAMPQRLDAYYVAEDSSKQSPVMLHRAILGSLERFTGILLEHYAGKLPAWLAPVQAVVLNITDKQADFAQKVVRMMKKQGLRVNSDLRNEKIGFKIREHTIKYVPYLLVIGDRELETESVSVRTQDGKDLGVMPIDQCIELINHSILQKSRQQEAVAEEVKDRRTAN